MFFLYIVNPFVNSCVIINSALIWYFCFENSECQFVGTDCKYFLVGGKAVLRRNIFTMEGDGKGNGDTCSQVWERQQEEVMKLKDFNMDGGCQYIE
jgi:hypothetical protein